MPSARGSPAGLTKGAAGWLGWLRLDLVKLLLLAVPALAVDQVVLGVIRPAAGRPWITLALLLPLLAGVAVLAWSIREQRPRALGIRYLAFFIAFCLFFSLATESDLLSGPRRLLAGYEDQVPTNFLALNGLGDWHYRVAPPAPPASDLLVVTFPSFAGQHREDARRSFAFLIRQAQSHGARGIAFDYFLAEESRADALLKLIIEQATGAGLPVLFGYRHVERGGTIVRQPIAASLAGAVPLARQGHLAGYLEADGLVRMVPVDLPGVGGELKSLSYRIAAQLAGGELAVPPSKLVQFTAPRGGVRAISFAPNADWELLRDRFVLAGPAAANDIRKTPFGELQGVMIHAYAAHSLRTSHFIHRLDRHLALPAIFALCFALTVLQARGAARRSLLVAAAGLAAAVLAGAGLAMRLGLVWIDVSYPLAAIGLLTGLFVTGSALRTVWVPRPRTSALVAAPDAARPSPATKPEGERFQVFLSHNGKDRDQVRQIGIALRDRGLKPWLDEWELVPGRPWQEALEEILQAVSSSAVFVGSDGLGPWEIPEMRASLSECIRRGLPVIPVLLPKAPQQPVLPLFLTQYTWVDLRGGVTQEGLDRLEWGIIGVKPGRRSEKSGSK